MHERFLIWTFWAATTFAFAMAVQPYPINAPVAQSDKVLHMLAFLTLGGLAAAAYPRHSLIRIWIGLTCFGALIELVQSIPALGRDSDMVDLAADSAAAAVALLLALLVRRLRAGMAAPPDRAGS